MFRTLPRLALLGAVLAALWSGPSQAQPVGPPALYCDKVAVSGGLVAGTAQVVAGVTGQRINICGYMVEGLAAGTAQIVIGTGASCTSPTNLSSVMSVGAASNTVNHPPNVWFSTTAGQSVCAIVTGTGTVVAVDIYYSQL